MKLSDPLTKIPFLGEKYANNLMQLSLFNIKDLLFYFPRDYSDSSQIYSIKELSTDKKKTCIGKLKNIKTLKTRSRISIQKANFEVNGENLTVTWFNQPYLIKNLKEDTAYLIYGKLNPKVLFPEMLSPDIEELSMDTKHIGRITPIYPLTSGIKQKWLRARLKWLIEKLNYISDLSDKLEPIIKTEFKLMDLFEALTEVHFPSSKEQLKEARDRLGFDELFEIQKKIEKRRLAKANLTGKPIEPDNQLIDEFKNNLPFKLTSDQSKIIDEVISDIGSTQPAERLIQGDVGSGKTIVAMAAALAAVRRGYKVVYMAPTTILSEQIYNSFKVFLKEYRLDIKLINSSKKEIDDIKNNSILIGTHALLFQDSEILKNLNLIIIDEEHKFGVKQREGLTKLIQEDHPHKITITATPIPRSLAMTIWGDTTISYIKTKPKDRKEIKTLFVPQTKIVDSYNWLENEVNINKSQIFWVCPLIEESEILEAKSAETTYKEVQKRFPDKRVRLVHGKTKDKEKMLEDFKNHKFDILVTTPIIEVGIDIPNANYIVIESCERFGLAQLHQFRGRVGRSEAQGYCILFASSEELNEDQKSRIKFFTQTTDGLELAEFDLKRRGPGEVYGTKQSGIPDLKIANIFDMELITKVQKAVKMIDINP